MTVIFFTEAAVLQRTLFCILPMSRRAAGWLLTGDEMPFGSYGNNAVGKRRIDTDDYRCHRGGIRTQRGQQRSSLRWLRHRSHRSWLGYRWVRVSKRATQRCKSILFHSCIKTIFFFSYHAKLKVETKPCSDIACQTRPRTNLSIMSHKRGFSDMLYSKTYILNFRIKIYFVKFSYEGRDVQSSDVKVQIIRKTEVEQILTCLLISNITETTDAFQ